MTQETNKQDDDITPVEEQTYERVKTIPLTLADVIKEEQEKDRLPY